MLNFRVKECDLSDNATSASQNDDALGDKKLKLAGYSYMLGDAAMMAADVVRGNRNAIGAIGAGGIWFAGGAAAARYGNPNADKQLELIANKLERHLKKNGVTIPEGIREQNALLKKETTWQRIEDFLYEHPSEMLNASYALGAGMLVKQGIEQMKAGSHTLLPGGGNLSAKFWIGSIVATGALIGLFAKEDPQAKEKARNGGFVDKVLGFVREKPLRTTSALYFLNNGFLAADAWQDFKKAKPGGEFHAKGMKPHYFSTLQLATYLFSNTMLAMSSRNQISSAMDTGRLAQMEDAAARIIAAQPGEVQQALLGDISRYLAEQKGLGQDASQIAQALAARLTELTGERAQQAANAVSWVEREKARSGTAAEQSL